MDMIGKVKRMTWRDQLSDGEICKSVFQGLTPI